jgi:Abnormal spindle-like microcephaly-assoc'd, ASPM-SPD-2-Hydin
MNHLRSRWNATLVVVALASLLGCQGLAPKPQTQGAGQLTPSPASISFGNVQVGTNQSQGGSVTNTGGSSVTITQVAASGSGYSVSGITVPLTLAAGQGASFSVVFAPASAGSASGNVAFSSSVGTVNVALSGTGVAAGALNTSPTSFSFGNVTLGYSSSQTETLKNTGGEPLTITAAQASGAGFSYSGLSLPLTLAANQASTFGVNFAPTVAGASSGQLALTISGSSTAVDIALSGQGVTPATLTPSPASLTFTNIQVSQSSTQTETVTNTGGSNAQITQVTPSGTGFSVSGITLPVTLIPGQGTSFSVTFAPQSAGSFTGSVSVISNASNSDLSVPLSGSAVSGAQTTLSVTTPINVGNVVVGTSGTQTGMLTATGGTVVVSSVNMGGANAAEFSVSGLSFPVTVTTSQPVNFTVTFTPSATGAASATASFASNASNSPTVANLTGTGTAAPVHTVSLSWNASITEGVTSYNVYRAIFVSNSCGSYSDIGSTSGSETTYTDSNVTDGTTYCYVTTAVDTNGQSGYSNVAQAVIPAP